jgi:hypothetical protein
MEFHSRAGLEDRWTLSLRKTPADLTHWTQTPQFKLQPAPGNSGSLLLFRTIQQPPGARWPGLLTRHKKKFIELRLGAQKNAA